MSTDLKPPAIEITAAASSPDEGESLKSGTRTPRPYHHDGVEIQQENDYDTHVTANEKASSRRKPAETVEKEQNGQASVAASESGTEADDERPNFVKALPAPHLRPRKGLKTGEKSEDALLTPSQLDDEGRWVSQDYFRRPSQDTTVSREEQEEEQERLLRRRLAEFARRCSEVGLVAVIIICVLCGLGVLRTAYQWRRELMSQVVIIATLILIYPVKLSIVDTTSRATKLWQRFRVPASFDPATVLYPTLLPVLVALSISPTAPATILPNIILGLASLPQRLFPRSTRLGSINALHWFISIIPLIAAENTAWPSEDWPAKPYVLKCAPPNCIWPEVLVSLYPLHHALLQPLQYLTTTSLLISEVHLLSAALINLLLLASSPQVIIIKACLWIGGSTLFIFCARVLHWNVTLMRVPKWKFRREGHTVEERKSLVDAVSELINVQRATAVFKSAGPDDSDADEDEPTYSIKDKANWKPKLNLANFSIPLFGSTTEPEPKSAVDPGPHANGVLPESNMSGRARRNTLPVRRPPVLMSSEEPLNHQRDKSSNLLWFLHFTPAQAQRRKYIYAAYIYFAMATIVFIPVRYYVLEKALQGQEPIGWAIGYLLVQIEPIRPFVMSLDFHHWICLPLESSRWQEIQLDFPLDMPSIRDAVGPANMRLLLIAYWAVVLLAGLLAVFSLTTFVEVDTRRKVFHGVMVAMMLPTAFIDPCALALALTLILAVFLLLEVIRAGQVLPLGKAIGRFVAPYVDGRDLRGPVVISHLFLLTGCAVPLWFSLASIPRTGGLPWPDWELVENKREVAMMAGVICVGMGDAAASLIGRRYGRRKWPWVGGKSLEGSAAFAAAVTVGLMASKAWLVFGGWSDNSGPVSGHLGVRGAVRCLLVWHVTLAKAIFCACGTSFMEAVLTGANDNVVVPVALWLLVKGVRL